MKNHWRVGNTVSHETKRFPNLKIGNVDAEDAGRTTDIRAKYVVNPPDA